MYPEAEIPALQVLLQHSCGPARANALLNWEKGHSARICHPQQDHLLPPVAALGAAENKPAALTYHDQNVFGGAPASSGRIGECDGLHRS